MSKKFYLKVIALLNEFIIYIKMLEDYIAERRCSAIKRQLYINNGIIAELLDAETSLLDKNEELLKEYDEITNKLSEIKGGY